MRAQQISHKGKRQTNEDLVLERFFEQNTYFFSIIDGMGGYGNGDLAARMIAENMETYLSTVSTIGAYHIQKAINKSNLAIRQKNAERSIQMGAALGGVILKDRQALFYWVGDVKIFHFRGGKLIFESSAHTLANELRQSGSITAAERLSRYKHVVTRSISGDSKSAAADFHETVFSPHSDLIIVCTDGVHDLWDGLQLETMIQENHEETLLEVLKTRLLHEAADNFSLGLLSSQTVANI
ncbi:PP2C family protein-serine/threonine phosphatase [Mucilaginibacter lacusdianchii]|uniref:PP2C family protein-serine/threonine phosphatase n=1 Tax=Mucilaginibacter lacusdianchii TaxID=2684211 RepID=UPI00131B12B6|nr:protein phosphatase 2C domain-containing protein [Mucilaginibacter sp. JXJ CY 39]